MTQDVEKAGFVKCDFSEMLDRDVLISPQRQSSRDREIGPFRYLFQLSANSLEVEVLHWRKMLGRCVIEVKTDTQPNVPENDFK